jgi:NAD(P)-dependent dehydrogenase (short-subunit alcohol dehydrogenase family)
MAPSEDGRVVVVTGANRGLGYHITDALVDDGYRVAGLDVALDRITPLAERVPEQVRSLECDVTETEAVEGAISAVIDEWGRIDILVNNAGVAPVAPFEAHTPAETRRVFEVNYFGYLRTIRTVLPHMRERGDGIIHNVSSGTAYVGHPGLSGYAATKGAIEAVTRSLRLELRDEDVACTLMQPPMMDTQLSADLGYPDWMLTDPATVGRKLATQVESTDRVVTADLQTSIGLALIRLFPSLWRYATARLFDPVGEEWRGG